MLATPAAVALSQRMLLRTMAGGGDVPKLGANNAPPLPVLFPVAVMWVSSAVPRYCATMPPSPVTVLPTNRLLTTRIAPDW